MIFKILILVLQAYILITTNKKLNKIMAKQETFDALLVRVEAATTELANDLAALRGEIAAGTVSEESLAKFDTIVSTLEAMGKDPENPVPEG